MTYAQVYAGVVQQLEKAGCDSPAFDAVCLLEDIGGLPRGGFPRGDDRPMPPDKEAAVRGAARQRAQGRPLQYILGEWEFLTLRLRVGEGVLIPRPDTELLCEAAAERLARVPGEPPHVLDLCAGTGCVGLGVCSLFPGAQVTAVELSEQAFAYLQENIRRYPAYAVRPVRADVLRDAARFDGPYQAILSNPPYIPSADLPTLMREVQHEPRMALDGGEGEGVAFYRAIARDWTGKLCPGGFCAVEVGIGQAARVAALLEEAGLCSLEILRDMGGIDRVVVGWKPPEK